MSICSAADRFEIQIKDNGSGIPKEIIKEIGVRPISYGKPKGNGLGLYHCFGIIKEWGGKVAIESNDNGTSICISIPAARL